MLMMQRLHMLCRMALSRSQACHALGLVEREREIHCVHSASLAYDGILFMSEPSAARQ